MKPGGPGRCLALSAAWLGLVAGLPIRAAGTAEAEPLDRCEEMVRSDPGDYRSYACFWGTGRAEGSLDEAARRLSRLLDRQPDNPYPSAYLARIEADLGRPESAEEHYRRAADGYRRAGIAIAEAYLRMDFSFFLAVHEGRVDEAEAELARVRSLLELIDDPMLPAWLATREAVVANKRLEFGRALRLLRGAEPTIFPDGPWVLRQIWLSYMGYTARALGRLDDAALAWEREAGLLRSAGRYYEEAIPRRNLALLAILRGERPERCRILAREALETAERGKNLRIAAISHADLSALSDGPESLAHARAALAIGRRIGHFEATVAGLQSVALALADSDPAAALAAIDEGIELSERHRDLFRLLQSRLARASILRRTAPREVALRESVLALDAVEATRGLQPDPEIRARFFGVWTNAYYELATYLLEPPSREGVSGRAESDPVAEAFGIMERMRARALLDELDAVRASEGRRSTPEIDDRRRELLREIAGAQRRLFDPAVDGRARDGAESRLRVLEAEEAELREAAGRLDPRLAAFGAPDLASLEDIRRALDRDQLMLLFHLPSEGERRSAKPWLLAVTADRALVYPLPPASRLAPAIRLLGGLLERRGRFSVAGEVRLWRDLLSGAFRDLGPGIGRLVIVPDGPLYLLPFSALRSGPGEPPLGTRLEISIVPSASVWLHLRAPDRHEKPGGALVLADPEPASGGASSLERPAEASPPRPATPRSLPFARQEARTIRRRLGARASILLGPEASESAFKETDLSRFGIVHFAAHAVVDLDDPARSGIVLVPGEASEDGLLQMRDLYDLRLGGQLVVLSACRTAGGPVVSGEGPMSLARPFFLAGAPTVVGSLRPLRDRAAAVLFDRFYARLAEGASVGGAMAGARHDLFLRGAPPATWSGLVVLGDGDLVPFPGGLGRPLHPIPLRALLAAATLLGLALLILQRLPRRYDRA